MYNAQDRKVAIQSSIDDAKKFTKDLKSSKEEMKKMQNQTMKNLDEDLEKSIKETLALKKIYKKKKKKQLNEAIDVIEQISNRMKTEFQTLKKKNKRIFDAASKTIEMNVRSTKEMNLMHRITIMEFFTDYCDAKMYTSFESCIDQVPSLKDNFPEILEKIQYVKRDLIGIFSVLGK